MRYTRKIYMCLTSSFTHLRKSLGLWVMGRKTFPWYPSSLFQKVTMERVEKRRLHGSHRSDFRTNNLFNPFFKWKKTENALIHLFFKWEKTENAGEEAIMAE